MNKEIKNIAVKSVKLAGVTFVAAGAIALIASGAAIKAVTAGGKYLKDVAQKILEEGNEDAARILEEKTESEEQTEGDIAEPVEENPVQEETMEEIH